MFATSEPTKHAYLILAHEDPEMLNLLIKRLINTGHVYVHLDKRSRIEVNQVYQHPRVKVTKAIKVKWGGFSMIEATRLLANQALQENSTRLTLLSGLSYPIVKDEKLVELGNSNLDFVDAGFVDLDQISKPFYRRFTSKHFTFGLKQNLFGRIVRRLSREFWNIFSKLDPNKELRPIKLAIGSQWWSVTKETYTRAEKLLSENPNVDKYFKKIECSDESYFSTLFRVASNSHLNKGTTYVKWPKSGGPTFLNESDTNNAKATGEFYFARKFSSRDKFFLK